MQLNDKTVLSFFLFLLYQYGKSQKWGFEFGHSAHEVESLPLHECAKKAA